MRKPAVAPIAVLPMLPALPGWITSGPAEPLEAAAFRSGAALAHLAVVTTGAELPHALWRDRLALAAAEVCMGYAGRRDGQAALRDAVHLTKAGDDPGPAGRVFRQWSRAVARPVRGSHLIGVLEGIAPDRIALCLDLAGATPVDRAVRVIEAALDDNPRAEIAALILADAALATSLGWSHIVPLLSLGLKPRDLKPRDLTRHGDALRLACHRAVGVGVRQGLQVAAEVSRAAARLRAVAPTLRARGAARAVDLFLSRDALAPATMDFMSDRAARRLCDRLVSLGAVRELTGRDTFRLYGV